MGEGLSKERRSTIDDATTPPMLLLWSYLFYFFATMAFEARKATAMVYENAILVAVVLGVALNASAMGPGVGVWAYVAESPIRCLRFFLIPFCVSAFSAIVKAAEGDFTLIFPRRGFQAAVTVGASVGVPLLALYPLRRLAAVRAGAGGTDAAPRAGGGLA